MERQPTGGEPSDFFGGQFNSKIWFYPDTTGPLRSGHGIRKKAFPLLSFLGVHSRWLVLLAYLLTFYTIRDTSGSAPPMGTVVPNYYGDLDRDGSTDWRKSSYTLPLEEGKTPDVPEVVLEGALVNMTEGDVAQCVILLNGGQYQAVANRDGTFYINGVSVRSYLLTVTHPFFVFKPLLIEIGLRQSAPTITAYIHTLEHGKDAKVPYPLRLEPAGTQTYFLAPEEFNLLALVKNPMLLIGLVCMALMVLLPKLQNSLDPEALQELSQNRGTDGDANNAAGDYRSPFVQSLTSRSCR